jgi:hypothetical protein
VDLADPVAVAIPRPLPGHMADRRTIPPHLR